ncbi:MAG: hypothetical protein ACOH5I_14165 [Oligoflexus sp.]
MQKIPKSIYLFGLLVLLCLLVRQNLAGKEPLSLQGLEIVSANPDSSMKEISIDESMPAVIHLKQVYAKEKEQLVQVIDEAPDEFVDRQRLSKLAQELAGKRRFFAYSKLKNELIQRLLENPHVPALTKDIVISDKDYELIVFAAEILARSSTWQDDGPARGAVKGISKVFALIDQGHEPKPSHLRSQQKSLEILLGAFLKQQEISDIQSQLPQLLASLAIPLELMEAQSYFVEPIIYALFSGLQGRLTTEEIKQLVEYYIPRLEREGA